jgi:hypothetical protein
VTVRRCGRIVVAEPDLTGDRMEPEELARPRRKVTDQEPVLPRTEPATDQRLADLEAQMAERIG